MKIAYFSSSNIPSREANSVHVMKMCNAIVDKGCQVKLFAKETEQEIDRTFHEFYGVEHFFPVVRVRSKFLFSRFKELFSAYLMSDMAKKEPFDMYYSRNLWALFFSHNRVPFIYESHAIPSSQVKVMIEKLIIKSKNFQKLVVISNALKNDYMKLHDLSENQIIVAHDGADIPQMESKFKNTVLKGNGKLNVGYIGHLYKGRGIDVILQVAKKSPNYDFHIIGGNRKDIDYWEKKYKENKINNVYFYGFIPNGELSKYYEEIEILLAPYQNQVRVSGNKGDTSRWMSPLKIFEYMSHEKAIISSEIPVLKEVLKHKENALLCPPRDVDAWVSAIKLLSENSNLREKISKNAFITLKEEYTWTKRFEKIYNSLELNNVKE